MEISKKHSIPETYEALMRRFPLRPIRDDIALANAGRILDQLAVRGDQRTPDQEDYLEVLAGIVERYEEERHPIDTSHLTPLDRLKALLDENGLSASDLGNLLGDRALGSKILRGERELSKAHVRILAERFRINAGALLM